METTFLNVIPESKLKQILQESAQRAGISLLLYDKFGQLIMQYPNGQEQAFMLKKYRSKLRIQVFWRANTRRQVKLHLLQFRMI